MFYWSLCSKPGAVFERKVRFSMVWVCCLQSGCVCVFLHVYSSLRLRDEYGAACQGQVRSVVWVCCLDLCALR